MYRNNDLEQELEQLGAASNFTRAVEAMKPGHKPASLLDQGEILLAHRDEGLVVGVGGEVHVLCPHGNRRGEVEDLQHVCCE